MSVRTAVLTEDPRPVEGSDGVTRYRARALDSLTGYGLDCQINLRAGEWYPFRKGDRVQIILPFGSTHGAEIVGHKGLPGCDVDDPANTEICARLKADGETRASLRLLAPQAGGGGRVDLGEGAPDEQEQIAMHPKVAAELRALWGALDALTDVVGALTYNPGPSAAVPVIGASAARPAVEEGLGGETITGGHPATNVYAKPDTE